MSIDIEVKAVEERVNILSLASWSELSALPETSNTTLEDDRGSVLLTVWRDTLQDGRLQIVVQGVRPPSGVRRMIYARGFKVTADGCVTLLTDSELSDFR